MDAVEGCIVAYGGRPNLRTQANYALLSALAFGGDAPPAFTIYTDAPEWFASFSSWLRIEKLDAARIHALTGGSGDPYRLKLAAIRDAALRNLKTPVLFIDADTFFIAPYHALAQLLHAGQRVMHRREYAVATHPTGQMKKFRRAIRHAGMQDSMTSLSMWNSGVVGLPANSAQIVDDALQTLAQLEPHTKKKYLAEQFSISVAMNNGATVMPAEGFIFHYWFQKEEYTRAIEQRLQKWRDWPLPEQLAALRAEPLMLPAPPQKLHWWERALINVSLRDRPEDPRGLPKIPASKK